MLPVLFKLPGVPEPSGDAKICVEFSDEDDDDGVDEDNDDTELSERSDAEEFECASSV